MHPLQKQFHDYIIDQQLFSNTEKVLLAVSGGMDSMVLSQLFHESGYSFSIAHCNFGLRGKESDGDEKLVREWAQKRNVECHVKQIELGNGSIQLEARNSRYEWFDKLMEEYGYDKVATAHHLNDSLETTLINLSRGTGIKGIGGIQPDVLNRVRPLLFATQRQIKDYAQIESVEWREDASNAKKEYNRNLIRHDVVPKLEEINPVVVDTFRNTSERLQLANEIVKESVREIKKDFLHKKDKYWKLETGWISTRTDMLILSEIVSDFGFNYATAKEIFKTVGSSGKEFYSDQYWLSIDRGTIYIQLKNSLNEVSVLIDGVGEWKVNDRKLIISREPKNKLVFSSDPSMVFFDESKINFPLTIRKWGKGDRFRPLGMNGSKKVSDYLIDKKVPMVLKGQVMVLTSLGKIVWLVEHQISDDYKVNEKTEELIKIKLQ